MATSARPTAQLPVTVIMNIASGSEDKEAARERIEQELAAAGRPFRMLTVKRPGDLAQLALSALEDAMKQPQIVVAAGGDGTVNAVAGALAGSGVPLAVVPLGTFNYFARELGIPLDTAAAVHALLDGKIERATVAMINGHVFLVNASFGLYRRLQEDRERRKRRFGRNKVVDALSSLLTLLNNPRTYEVQLEIDGKPRTLRTLMILVGMNALQLEKLELPVAGCAANGQLAVLALRPMSRFALLRLALRGALQGLGDASNLDGYCASRVTVRLRGARRIKVAVDGESVDCSLPLEFAAMPDALTVVVPRAPEPRK